ncbi:hypothetical protein FF38_03282 [Lucilia cuprina]|uniref:Uncharacterized protein n=1 Tax=Lucilia cuprina TaxID=7375 RepID=A0A0L0CC80_LUCCU|nr:hypothetical protein FF38_03282 [Lucilia cuprina]
MGAFTKIPVLKSCIKSPACSAPASVMAPAIMLNTTACGDPRIIIPKTNCVNLAIELTGPVRVYPKEGKLGCGVGYGLLHQLPMVTSNLETHPPGSTLFDDSQYENNTSMSFEPLAPSVTPVHNRRRRAPAYNKNTTGDLDSYFNEQTEISQQIDGLKVNVHSSQPPPKGPQ